MALLRRILFYVFLVIYLAFCPLLILYSLGIIYVPERKDIEERGIIYLSTLPPGADFFINNKKFPTPTPTMINSLRPGVYFIRITHPGYLPWKKNLVVRPGKATAVEDILLIPQEWKIKTITDMYFSGLVATRRSPVLLKTGPLLKDLYVVKIPELMKVFNDNVPEQLPRAEYLNPLINVNDPKGKLKVEEIHSVEHSDYYLIEVGDKSKRQYFGIDLNSDHEGMEEITDLLVPQPEKVSWDSRKERSMYSLNKDGVVNLIDVEKRSIIPNIADQVKSFTIYDQRLYVLTRNNTLKELNAKGEELRNLSQDNPLSDQLLKDPKDIALKMLSPKIMIFLSEDGKLLSNQLPYILADKDIKGFAYNEPLQRLLLTKKNDIGIIDFNKEKENEFWQKGALPHWLKIPKKDIRQALWVNAGKQILFVDQDEIFLTESENFNQPEIHKIADIKKGTPIDYFEDSGVLLFLDQPNGHLMAVKIKNNL